MAQLPASELLPSQQKGNNPIKVYIDYEQTPTIKNQPTYQKLYSLTVFLNFYFCWFQKKTTFSPLYNNQKKTQQGPTTRFRSTTSPGLETSLQGVNSVPSLEDFAMEGIR